MTIITYLFFAIMIYVAFNVLRFMFGVWRQARSFRNTFNQFTNAANNAEQDSRSERGKKFAKTDGEYVDFEEVPDTASSSTDSNLENDDTYTAADDSDLAADDSDLAADDFGGESQISDAEYEEIK